MAWKRLSIPIAALGLLQVSAVIAQGPPPGLTMPNARFVNAPQVGEQFPDVTILDDQGNPVNISRVHLFRDEHHDWSVPTDADGSWQFGRQRGGMSRF